MKKAVDWVKTHKLATLLGLIIVLMLGKSYFGGYYGARPMMQSFRSNGSAGVAMDIAESAPMMYGGTTSVASKERSMMMPPIAPASESVDLYASDRKIVRNSDISLLVKDVRQNIDKISQHATSVGGFMVNSSVQTPTEGGTGYISIRVPSAQLDATLGFLRGLAVQVVSENVSGNDVTDQFTDTQARLETLNKTKATFEGMLGNASTVDEILRVQQSILQVQDQIDSLKGQLEYLEKTSQSSLISVYLSTDELALPYSPSEPWRPQIVFKTAVRSLVANLRSLANGAIWLGVYLPAILVVVVIGFFIKKKVMK